MSEGVELLWPQDASRNAAVMIAPSLVLRMNTPGGPFGSPTGLAHRRRSLVGLRPI